METTTSNNSKVYEKSDETFQAANKWANNFGSEMLNMYTRQLNLAFDFYRNLFNTFTEAGRTENKAGTNMNNAFLNTGQLFSSMFRPFKMDGNLTNYLSSQYEGADRQMTEFNTNLFSALQRETEQAQKNWSELNEKYGRMFEERLKANRDVVNSLMEAYFKQLNFAIAANRDFVEETTRQFNSALKQNGKLWSDVIKSTENFNKPETEKENKTEKESNRQENKYASTGKKQTVNNQV